MGEVQSSESQQGTPQPEPPAGGATPPQSPAQQELAGFKGSATGQPVSSPQGGDTGASGAPAGAQAGAEGQGATGGAGQPVVVGHGGKPMSEEAISERVARAQKAQLKTLFGTDDEAEIRRIIEQGKKGPALTQEQVEEYARLRRLNESRARARMTQEQRMKADLESRESKIQELENQLKQEREQNIVQQQDQIVSSIAAEHVAKEYTRYATRDLAEYLKELGQKDPAKLQKFGQKELGKWFKDYVAEKPAFAKQQPSADAPEQGGEPTQAGVPKQQPRRVVQRPVTTTRGSAQPPKPAPADPNTVNGKTPRPGQPNTMDRRELADYMKQQGLRKTW